MFLDLSESAEINNLPSFEDQIGFYNNGGGGIGSGGGGGSSSSSASSSAIALGNPQNTTRDLAFHVYYDNNSHIILISNKKTIGGHWIFLCYAIV